MKLSIGQAATAALLVAASWAPSVLAGPGCCDETNCPTCCESCAVCVGGPERVTEEKHCWCVECEEICVPRVRCPWEPGGSPLTCFKWLHRACGAGGCCDTCGDTCCDTCCDEGCCGGCGCQPCGCQPCGKVKCVRDLSKKTYEVEACEWKYEIRRLPPCCCSSCGASSCGCAASIGG